MYAKQLAVLSVTLGLAVSVDAAAQPVSHMGQAHGFGDILSAAQLSPPQRQQVHQILRAAHARYAPQAAQMRALQGQVEQILFSTGSVTAAQLVPLEQQEEALRQQLDASRIETALAIRAVLTSAQLARASSARAQLTALHQQERAIIHPDVQPGTN